METKELIAEARTYQKFMENAAINGFALTPPELSIVGSVIESLADALSASHQSPASGIATCTLCNGRGELFMDAVGAWTPCACRLPSYRVGPSLQSPASGDSERKVCPSCSGFGYVSEGESEPLVRCRECPPASGDSERLRKVAQCAASAILLAIGTEDGLDGQEGSDVLAALAECGITPTPLHEEGCVAEYQPPGVWRYVCVESCHHFARSASSLPSGETVK
jgi:hypothetical protein